MTDSSLLIVILSLAALLSLTHTTSASSSALECSFKSNTWNIYDYDRLVMNQTDVIRYCEVTNKEIFVNFVRIEALASQGSEDVSLVTGISFTQGTMNYFPHGIDSIFPSISAITAEESKLREIHVEDLAPFKLLKLLYLNGNEIRVIEADLFKFNEHLELLRLDFNQISHIDAQVFSHLVNLKFLWLNENRCKVVKGNAVGNRDEVVKLIKQVEDEKCINPVELNSVSTNHERVLRILEELEDLKSLKPDDDSLLVENKNLKSEITNLNSKVKQFDEKNQDLESKNANLEVKIAELNAKVGKSTGECDGNLESCQSDLNIKTQEIERLNKVIEQLQNQPPPSSEDNKKAFWKFLISTVISLLILIVLVVGIVMIVVKINFIIQKLKDQFQHTMRRPLNVPNDFWHHEE